MGPREDRNQKQIYFCAICHGPGGTKHHLIPKAVYVDASQIPDLRLRRKETIRTCRKCHDDIHWYFSHWELAMKFNTEDLLKPELSKRKTWCGK